MTKKEKIMEQILRKRVAVMKEKLMNTFKQCNCGCIEGVLEEDVLDNPYCDVHGTECGCCGDELTNKACNNRYCSAYDPIGVLTGYKTGENNVKNDCRRCIELKIGDFYHRVRKQSLDNVYYFCVDCD